VDHPPRPLWRNRPFATFWLAQAVSYTGSQVSELAIPLTAALTLGATAGQMGALGAAELLPPLLLSLVAGLVVDRLRRAPLLLACLLGQGLVLATIPAAARAGVLGLPQVVAVAFLNASLALFASLAVTAYLPVLVDRRQLVAANSLVQLSDSIPAVGGPGLAGLLVQLLSAPIAVAADAISFLAAAALLLGARRPEPATAAPAPLGGSVREGVAAFLARPGLWGPAAAMGWQGLFYAGILALLVLYAVRDLGLTPAQLGLALTIASAGPLLAAAAAGPAVRRFGPRWTPVLAAVLYTGDLLIPLAGGPTWLVIALLAVAQGAVGLSAVTIVIVRSETLQRTVPAELVGRAGAVVHLVQWGTLPAGSLLGGVLGQRLGLRGAIAVLAAGASTAIGWVLAAALTGRPARPADVRDRTT
jgi:MFS family permease